MTQFFDPASYSFSPYAIPVVLFGGLNAGLGIATAIRERGSRVSLTFCAMTLAVAIWLLSFGAVYSTDHRSVAFAWVRVEHFGLAYLATSVYVFALTITDQLRAKRAFAAAAALASACFFVVFVRTDWMLSGIRHHYWGYYSTSGPWMFVFLLFFGGQLMASVHMIRHARDHTQSPANRRRLAAIASALGIAYLASGDFLPTFGVPLYPFGYLFIGGFVVLATRAIWRDRLVDITPALAANKIVETMADGVLLFDRDGVVRVANGAVADMLASTAADLVGTSVAEIDARWFQQALAPLIGPGFVHRAEVTYRRQGSQTGTMRITSTKIADRGVDWLATVCIMHDITERKAAEETIRHLAFHDALAGVANRPVLMDRLSKSLAQARRSASVVGLLFLDLDRFKQINDQRGHDAGDQVLKRVAGQLDRLLREGDTLARVGGDEFVLLLPGINHADEAALVARRILHALKEDRELAHVSASIGIASFPLDAHDDEGLLRNADIAMYEAKRCGGGDYRLFADLPGSDAPDGNRVAG